MEHEIIQKYWQVVEILFVKSELESMRCLRKRTKFWKLHIESIGRDCHG